MKNGNLKLSDVARVAGVSLSTASRALSRPQRLSPATVDKVRSAAQLLGYVPHGAARALASRRSRTIGAVIPTLDNSIFASSVNAMQQSLAASSFNLLLASHGYDPMVELEVTRTLIERGVDGIAFVGTDHAPALYELLGNFDIPYVFTWSLDMSAQHPSIGFNNRDAAIRVTRHLLDLGHKNLAVISGLNAHNDRSRDRVAGVREAMRARGLELPDAAIIEEPYSFLSGRQAMHELMQQRPRPTAVVCINDVLAVGAIIGCQAEGVRIPQDVSVTGFDDMEISGQLSPGLTTMRLPTVELGRLTANYLLDRLAGKEIARLTELKVELVVRGSTAPPAPQD